MPKGEIKKTPINSNYFREILKLNKVTIIELAETTSCSEKTIRRALKEKKIRYEYLDEIGKSLNIDPRFLSGELFKEYKEKCKIEIEKQIILPCYFPYKYTNFPYFRKEKDELLTTDNSTNNERTVDSLYKRIFALFNISYSQFINLESEKQYMLKHEIIDSLSTIMLKYFKIDAFGNDSLESITMPLYELETYKEYHDACQYAENVLRPQYLKKPPKWHTVSEIEKMSTQDIIDLAYIEYEVD